MVNLDELLQPVTADAPGGTNLEYSPEFAELDRSAAGKPERQVGTSVIPAVEPDWRSLIEQSCALLKSTKDLRIAAHLVRALVRVQGFPGLADGLVLLREMVERYWDVFYPRLDPEDDHDPTSRVSVMAGLTHREMIQTIRATPILETKGFGAITLRDIEAAGQSSSGGPSPQAASVEAAFQQAPMADLIQAAQAVQRCSDEARKLVEVWRTRLDGAGPDFTEFRGLLEYARRFVEERVALRQPAQNGIDQGTQSAAHQGGAGRGTSDLRSREDVMRALDGICAYYVRNEPSSPVPLLIERCKRLVTMSFIDIVQDMLPDSVATIKTIAGKRSD
jgi:type VI secretion system protein ImpA